MQRIPLTCKMWKDRAIKFGTIQIKMKIEFVIKSGENAPRILCSDSQEGKGR